jgi:prophage regulatory protein
MRLLKKTEVLKLTAKSNTTLYSDIKLGLMIPACKISQNSVAWPEHEIFAINAARVAGKSDEQIKKLVTELVKLRKGVPNKSESELRTTISNLIGGA